MTAAREGLVPVTAAVTAAEAGEAATTVFALSAAEPGDSAAATGTTEPTPRRAADAWYR